MVPSRYGTTFLSAHRRLCTENPYFIFFFVVHQPQSGLGRGYEITLRHTRLGRAVLDEGSARRRDLYLTTHNTHKRQTSTPPTGFDPAIQASERPQTYAIYGAATWIGRLLYSISVYRQSRYTATNCGGQSVELYRVFSVYLTEPSGFCMEHTFYF